MTHPALAESDHRPWPVPAEPWLWRQTWHDLAFLHWPVEPSRIAPLVPRNLMVDEFDGRAWLAVTPFWMSGVTLRGVPALPILATFPELNVRTYVRHGDRPGVWFFSLDVTSRLAVWTARRLFHLPYGHADMNVRRTGQRTHYSSHRATGHRFLASYEPTGAAARSVPGTLEHFLTERYCLYSQSQAGALYRAEIHHAPWPLQQARADIQQNDMLALHGLSVTGAPIVHFAKRLDVVIWPIHAVVR